MGYPLIAIIFAVSAAAPSLFYWLSGYEAPRWAEELRICSFVAFMVYAFLLVHSVA
jgi:hypothetical protein